MTKEYSCWDTFLAESADQAIELAIDQIRTRRGPVEVQESRTEVVGPFSPQMRGFDPPYLPPSIGAFDVLLWWTEPEPEDLVQKARDRRGIHVNGGIV